MKADEFRIGNLIFDSEVKPHIFEVEELRKHVGLEVWIVYDNGRIKTKEAEVIPLNDEWFKKFGYSGRTDFIWKGKTGVHIKEGRYYFAAKDMGNVIYQSLREIKYVHELQNLYYDFESIKLKPKES